MVVMPLCPGDSSLRTDKNSSDQLIYKPAVHAIATTSPFKRGPLLVCSNFKEIWQDLEAAIELHMEEMTEIESRIATATIQVLQECLPFKMQDKEVAEDLEAAELVDLFDGL